MSVQFSESYSRPQDLPTPIINDPSLPLISIVTPSYNQGQFIRATIESVLTQDYPNIEYWVIDAQSNDDTMEIVREYEYDPRFHWISEPDRGQSDAINKGLARSQGEIFSWLNSDDMLLPSALSNIVAGWKTMANPCLVYGLGRHIDENGNDLGYCPAQSSSMTLDKLLWVGKTTLVQPATFAPTHAVREIGGLNLTLNYALDLDLWIRLAETLPIKFVGHDIALYRLHSSSKTVSLPSKFINDIEHVLNNAVTRNSISQEKAHIRYNLFALRTYLMPGSINLSAARRHFVTALKIRLSAFFEASTIIVKAIVRIAVGDKIWRWARLMKARMS